MPRVIFSSRHVEQPHPRQRVVYEAGKEYLIKSELAEKLVAQGKAIAAAPESRSRKRGDDAAGG